MSTANMPKGLDLVSLIQTHQAGLWRYLRSLGCDPAEAEELTQETFLVVMERPIEDYHASATAAYLRKVARSLFITARRKEQRGGGTVQLGVADFDPAELDGVDADWARWGDRDQGASLLEALRDCLESLTERALEALEMRYRYQNSREEIASAMGLTEHGAKNLLQRAKEQLRACIERKLG